MVRQNEYSYMPCSHTAKYLPRKCAFNKFCSPEILFFPFSHHCLCFLWYPHRTILVSFRDSYLNCLSRKKKSCFIQDAEYSKFVMRTRNMTHIIIMFVYLEFCHLQIHQVLPSSSSRRLIDIYVIATWTFSERVICE